MTESRELNVMRMQALCRAIGELKAAQHTIYTDHNEPTHYAFEGIDKAIAVIEDECM